MEPERKITPTERISWTRKVALSLRCVPWMDAAFLGLGLLLALLLRYFLRGIQTTDYQYYFQDWYAKIQAEGFRSLGENFSNYPPLYLMLLYLVSVVLPHVAAVTAVKIPSILCDFICAWYVYRLVRLKREEGTAARLSIFAVLFAPTVILNGAAWGQIESIYTAALLACLYYLLRKKNWLACVAFGLSFAIKLQAVYLAPFLLAYWLKERISWKYLLAIPAVYLLTILPAWIAGRPLAELLTIYVSQVGGYEGLVHNATSFYTWLPLADYKTWYVPGTIFAAGVCLAYVYLILKSKVESLEPHVVKLALASLLIVPFFLPKTHDRYFFPADVVSIVFGFYYPKYFYVPIIVNLTSFFIYQPYLFNIDIFPQPVLTLAMFVALVIVMWRVVAQLYPKGGTLDE